MHFISDNNSEVAGDIEKSLKLLRGIEGTLQLGQIIEKSFFIDSRQSLLLQLCDQCAYCLRKMEERVRGLSPRRVDDEAIEQVRGLVHRGDERLLDVLKWLAEHRQQGATRN